MSANSSIEWTDRTWNPVRGCSVISPGCVNCYAMKQAHRFSGPGRAYEGLTKLTKAGPQWTGVIRTVPDELLEPLSWRKPQRVFVNSMSDLFHEDVPELFISEVFATMAMSPRHTFQILTKRPERMREYMSRAGRAADIAVEVFKRFTTMRESDVESRRAVKIWPLPNVWLGVSVENQQYADERIPLLLQTPAAVRFISAEPLLGEVRLVPYLGYGVDLVTRQQNVNKPLDWVIVGGESGPGARPFHVDWARSIVSQCKAASVQVFVKQLGAQPLVPIGRQTHWDYRFIKRPENKRFVEHDGEHWLMRPLHKKGGDIEEFPEDLRIREFPKVAA